MTSLKKKKLKDEMFIVLDTYFFYGNYRKDGHSRARLFAFFISLKFENYERFSMKF